MGRRKDLKKNPIDREAEAKAIEEMQIQLKEKAEARQAKIRAKNKYNLLDFQVEKLLTLKPKEKKSYIKELHSYT